MSIDYSDPAGDYVGKMKIRSDGTVAGTRIVVLNDAMDEEELRGVVRVVIDVQDGLTRATLTVVNVSLDIAAAPIVETVAAEEREACAKIAESEGENPGSGWGGGPADVGHSIAAAIRARKSTPVHVDPAVAIDYDASAETVR
jgi:hypothetical protein